VPLARTRGVALVGVEGHLVEVEADLGVGVPSYTLVGLPDASLSESRDRVRAAMVNTGHDWPVTKRVTVNLSPASLPKRGSSFDLCIAGALLGAQRVVPEGAFADAVLLGELGLDGRVRPVRGVLPAVAAAARAGVTAAVVPQANAAEAALVPGVTVTGVRTLAGLVARARDEALPDVETAPEPEAARPGPPGPLAPEPDLADVLGQPTARFLLEVAAAGGHHLLMLGPPGAGKTMLAERLPGLLPELDPAAALEVTAVHSVAGLLDDEPLVRRPPFQAPHHTASVAAVVGGGSTQVRPGVVSLAHRGVLFMDEAPEFAPAVLDALREPLESGQVTVARLAARVRFPARFQLVLAANPCPCGLAGAGPAAAARCTCTPMARVRYLGRLSGPLLDRVDLQIEMLAATRADLRGGAAAAEGSAAVAARVAAARERTAARLSGTPWRVNAEVPGPVLRRRWRLPWEVVAEAERLLDRGALTARGVDRVVRVAWTLADLAGRDQPDAGDVRVALDCRGVARWAA